MKQIARHRANIHHIPAARVAALTFAIGGLSASLFIGGTASATTNGAAKRVVISTTKNSHLGTLLVSDTTLYTLKPSKTACTSACMKVWPEVTLPKGVTKATAGSGVSAAKLGTIKRANGVLQVTYAGKALYWFSGDSPAGQVNGNVTDTWGTWSDVVTVKPASSASSSTSAGNTGTGGVAF
jgi:predicted lipoprotein with Yx(FWY)xxD motif